MRVNKHSFQEYIDALQTARDGNDFERVAARVSQGLGFRWFAYLNLAGNIPLLVSSYPKTWTDRYFNLNYQDLDPVVQRVRRDHYLFDWSGVSKVAGSRDQRRFFDEAMTFGITSGLTVPINAGFGQTAAFTFAADDRAPRLDQLTPDSREVLQLIGMYFHMHLKITLGATPSGAARDLQLTQRECQCLAWMARGKTIADAAALMGISPRTVAFHLDNARRKFGAASITQCVAEALRRGLLP